jgi:two-component system, OmpR family, sensor histidine kinase MprB
MTLRIRLALVGALVAILAAGLVAGVSYQLLSNRLAGALDDSLETTSWLFKEAPRRAETADPFRGQDLGEYAVQALRSDGGSLSLAGPALPVGDTDREIALGRKSQAYQDVVSDGRRWRMLTAATSYGAVQVAVDTAEARRSLQTLQVLVAVAALGVGGLGAAIAWRVTSRALAPLEDLTVAVEQVANGDLDVEVAGGEGEVGRVADAFNRTISALQQSRSEQRRLVQDAGHDLRTPLTSITANVSMLRRIPLSDEERDAVLSDLAAETRSLSDLVEQIIDAATGAPVDEAFDETDLATAVEKVAGRLSRLRAREITVVSEPALATVQPRSFERAVVNLVENAVKFSTGAIDVTVARSGEHVWVHVLDRGPGLGAGDGERIFERFWRADTSRARGGSGLGLAIVAAVAERHGGETSARNRDGGGADIGFSVRGGTST